MFLLQLRIAVRLLGDVVVVWFSSKSSLLNNFKKLCQWLFDDAPLREDVNVGRGGVEEFLGVENEEHECVEKHADDDDDATEDRRRRGTQTR